MRLAHTPSEPSAVAVVSVETAANLAGSRAGETRRAYRRMVGRWAEWATRRGVWPKTWTSPPSEGWRSASAGDVADWLSFLASEGLGISAVRTARAAVTAAHREGASLQALAGGEGLSDPTQDWLVSATIGGIARRADPPAQAAGLRVDGFARILATLELEATPATPRGRRAIRDTALLWVMRDGLLRRGETAALRWDDLTVDADRSGRLTISRSKTDQTGEGAVLWISPPAIAALQRWQESGHHQPLDVRSDGPVGRAGGHPPRRGGGPCRPPAIHCGWAWPRTSPLRAQPFPSCARRDGGSHRQRPFDISVPRRPTGERWPATTAAPKEIPSCPQKKITGHKIALEAGGPRGSKWVRLVLASRGIYPSCPALPLSGHFFRLGKRLFEGRIIRGASN